MTVKRDPDWLRLATSIFVLLAFIAFAIFMLGGWPE